MQDNVKRISAITHIHELAAKDEFINSQLLWFYDIILRVADSRGLKISKLFPNQIVNDETTESATAGDDTADTPTPGEK